jgi:hypothetical protein
MPLLAVITQLHYPESQIAYISWIVYAPGSLTAYTVAAKLF